MLIKSMSSGYNCTSKLLKNITFVLIAFFATFNTLIASESNHKAEKIKEKFKSSEMIIHHIGDSHEWHLASSGNNHFTIPLPVILYSNIRGLQFMMSSQFVGGHEAHAERKFNGFVLDSHDHIVCENKDESIIDFSITKNATSMILCGLIMIIIFVSIASSFVKNSGKAPKGVHSFFEPLVVFIRDEIAIPNIGKDKYKKYLPYLLTAFFFIWINNMLGLIPTGANVTGNIAVTLTLAVITAVITNFSGNKAYWGHIFATPGVPMWLLPIMLPVELIGILTKPFALMIRLFANITAGHIIILSIISFIFIFESSYVGLASVPFAVLMTMMEVFVAILQAYIFTLLSALFIGQAVADHAHDDQH